MNRRPRSTTASDPRDPTGAQPWLVRGALLLAVALCYGRTAGFDFVTYDDQSFIVDNPQVWKGLNLHTLQWAFSLETPTGWNPLAWLSHLVDCQLFGDWAGGHHLVNVVLHACNALLLLGLLRRLSIGLWPSAAVAMLLAVHPLHVESVAWIAERRDVLSLLFALLTLRAYVAYTAAPSALRYLGVLLLFALALLSKPMMVTLPAVLLMMDVWPLRRIVSLPRRIAEKLPLVALSLLAAWLTLRLQHSVSAVVDITNHAPLDRLANAVVAYAHYLLNLIKPDRLAAFYPLRNWESWRVLLAAAVLLAVTAVAWRTRRAMPWICFGWLWYLGTLVPVIGLVQVGSQSHADRYTYLPMIGIYLAIVLTIAELARRHAWPPRPLAVVAAVLFAAISLLTCIQVGYWRDSFTLYHRMLAVTSNNHLAHNNLAVELVKRARPGDIEDALYHYEKALQAKPRYSFALVNLGRLLVDLNQPAKALTHLFNATEVNWNDPSAHYELAVALDRLDRKAEAIECVHTALKLNPDDAAAKKLLERLTAAGQNTSP